MGTAAPPKFVIYVPSYKFGHFCQTWNILKIFSLAPADPEIDLRPASPGNQNEAMFACATKKMFLH